MQGRNKALLTTTDKLYNFLLKLKLWKTNFTQLGVFEIFPFTKNATRAVNRDILKRTIGSRLEMLLQRFKSYFPDLNIFKYDWVRNPFNQFALSNARQLKLKAQEQLAEMCMDRTLQLKYNQMDIDNFSLTARQVYPEISQRSVQIIFPFSTTYFSSLSQIKTKSIPQLKSFKNELRVCLTSISSRIKTICAQKQAHVSH